MTADRKGQRKQVALLLRLQHPNVDRFVEEFATNVSDSGMFVRTRTPAPVGTRVNFEVRLAQGDVVLKGSAAVRWCRTPDNPAGPPGMGLEFTSLEESTRKLVDRMVGHKAQGAQRAKPVPAVAALQPLTPLAPLTPSAPAPTDLPPVPAIPPATLEALADEPLFGGPPGIEPLVPPPTPPDHVDLDMSADLLSEILGTAPSPASSDTSARGVGAALVPPRVTVDAPSELDDGDPFLNFTPRPASSDDAPTTQLPSLAAGSAGLDLGPGPENASGLPPELELFPSEPRDEPGTAPGAPAWAPPTLAPATLAPASVSHERPEPSVRTSARPRTVFLAESPPPKNEGPVIGVDLGTTNSCVAVLLNGKPTVLRTREGHLTLPSVISVNPQGKLLIGHRAKGQQLLNPTNTVYGAKRLVGRPFESAIVREVSGRFLYDICSDENGRAAVRLAGKVTALEEVQAIVLRECKELAESHLNRQVHRCVVTVPAYYSEPQRDAVRKAGELAGLSVTRILNEPTAAALAYGLNRQLQRRVLVYDLGGGTFDATLLKVEGNIFEVLATGGDTFLGGVDFDNVLVDVLLERFAQSERIPFSGDRVALSRIADAAERAKMTLSERNEALVDIPMLMMDEAGTPRSLRTTLTRPELEKACGPLIDRTIEVLRDVLLDAKIKPSQIDDVILVGGQSRMPLVRAKLHEFLKKAPHAGVNADEAVAMGAALLAGTVDKASSIVLIDVLPVTIGVGRPGGKFERLLNRNSPLPASATVELPTTQAGQRMLEVFIFQGENGHVSGNEYLGTATVFGLPAGNKGTVKTKVTLRLSPECQLSVEATGPDGKPLKTKLEMQYSLQELQRKLEVSSEAASAAETATTSELRKRAGNFWSKLSAAFRRS